MAQVPSNPEIEQLAAAIGEEVYIDVARWHLYLRDAHLHTLLAEQLAPQVRAGKVDEDAVTEILQRIPVKVGGGRKELPLADLLPMQSLLNLLDVLEEFSRKWAQ
ncbi:hypothetical protein ACVW0Q_000624 [Thermostichus sp. MS-CIW-21]|jgi:hypothetical protein|uniref:DUF3181 family protein n=1 Tax=unclassified Synechococcus TaxID=2626047 RepID=UPI0000694431|nr:MULTISPECIES: DUF3181 family protein [unclassified Synechococcus]ABC99654.1 conserved hypothetical protein [Synechococcus sp. JA-3-3Ab]PIK85064.1 thylakoid-associated protein [Synechococcus sp. 63AY4M2]PIK88312.1 thylakoid-associated protein [Synechococcus sp. 65AY6A5]PIK92748.1 thylakoid-associated protein [Synechococcus sp. 65AY6Li]PIK94105.1 thylakoid-associated protein [Synechococcus sp. 60AY4M2]